MGRWHATAVRRLGATVVPAVDTDTTRAARLGAPSTHTVLADALERLPIDVVHVCAPVDSHGDLAGTALAGGAHVIVEKPAAPDLATTDELLGLAARSKKLLVPVHQLPFQDGLRRVLARLDDLGDLVDLAFSAATAGAELGELDPDAVAADILPHPLSLFERLLPGSTAGAWQATRAAAGDVRASTRQGATTLSALVTTRGRPTRNELVVTGTSGTAHVDLFHGFATIERGGASRARKVARPFERSAATVGQAGANLVRRTARGEPAYPGLQALIRETYAAIGDNGPPPVTPEETRAVAAARDAILSVL